MVHDQVSYNLWYVPEYDPKLLLYKGGWDTSTYHLLKKSILKEGMINPILAFYKRRRGKLGMWVTIGNRRACIAVEEGLVFVPLLVVNYELESTFNGTQLPYDSKAILDLFGEGWISNIVFQPNELFFIMKRSEFN